MKNVPDIAFLLEQPLSSHVTVLRILSDKLFDTVYLICRSEYFESRTFRFTEPEIERVATSLQKKSLYVSKYIRAYG
jgi:hypothetical protein